MARAMKKIIVQPANPTLSNRDIHKPFKQLRVCAYARVSTDDIDQLTSYNAQVSYYTEYIHRHEQWTFVEVFTDEGISGTNTLKRTGFNKMIKMCKQGKINLIITKSVSRFARNTVDSLKTCQDLKERGIGGIFEKENISTLKDNIETHLTIASSQAQEESRSTSENVKWGLKRKFERGEIMLVTSKFIGYDMDDNGNLVINKEEAQLVRRIYDMFLTGYTYGEIAHTFMKEGIPTITGKRDWRSGVLKSILQNEKYTGNCVSQKSFTADFLTHKRVKNNGELNKYFIENHHDLIISLEVSVKESVKYNALRRTKKRYNNSG